MQLLCGKQLSEMLSSHLIFLFCRKRSLFNAYMFRQKKGAWLLICFLILQLLFMYLFLRSFVQKDNATLMLSFQDLNNICSGILTWVGGPVGGPLGGKGAPCNLAEQLPVCECAHVCMCVPNSAVEPRRQREKHLPLSWFGFNAAVRLLSAHGNRGEEGASVIVFIGSPLPCLFTWHLSPPGGAANDFKLISRYSMCCLWWGRMPRTERDEWLAARCTVGAFSVLYLNVSICLFIGISICSLRGTIP